jgi:acyl carrier protein
MRLLLTHFGERGAMYTHAQSPTVSRDLSAGGNARTHTFSAKAIEAQLIALLAKLVNIDQEQIDICEPFASYGLESIAAVSLSGDLGEWLGCQLEPTLLWDYPTITLLTRYLIETLAGSTLIIAACESGKGS